MPETSLPSTFTTPTVSRVLLPHFENFQVSQTDWNGEAQIDTCNKRGDIMIIGVHTLIQHPTEWKYIMEWGESQLRSTQPHDLQMSPTWQQNQRGW